jgi:hypothetical protein
MKMKVKIALKKFHASKENAIIKLQNSSKFFKILQNSSNLIKCYNAFFENQFWQVISVQDKFFHAFMSI